MVEMCSTEEHICNNEEIGIRVWFILVLLFFLNFVDRIQGNVIMCLFLHPMYWYKMEIQNMNGAVLSKGWKFYAKLEPVFVTIFQLWET